MRLKVLDKLFIKGFVGPCLLAFFVVEFVLIMQYLWKEIDKIIGKGYGAFDFLELLYYFGLVLIPMSLPLTILLSSVMVYGDMAEKYELSSVKSAGVSMVRMLKPGLVVASLVALFSLVASNYLKPFAYDGYSSKIKAMKSNKLTFAFDEKIFNNDFKNYAIRVGKKQDDGRTIEDVLIYDYSDSDKSVTNVIHAKKGEMYTSPDKRYLIMDLYDGYHFKEVRGETTTKSVRNFKVQGRPVMRYDYTSLRKVFDLEEVIDLSLTGSSYRKYEMMNTAELIESIDSFQYHLAVKKQDNIYKFRTLDFDKAKISKVDEKKTKPPKANNSTPTKPPKAAAKKFPVHRRRKNKNIPTGPKIEIGNISDSTKSISEIISLPDIEAFYSHAKKEKTSFLSRNDQLRHDNKKIERDIANHSFALHRMYSWALVCLLFLFIGGPAGAIVRKGGFGYPMLIAIGFYLTFVMTSIFGDKLVKSGSMSAVVGAWLPCFILLPFAIYLTWKALIDNRPVFKWNSKLFEKIPWINR